MFQYFKYIRSKNKFIYKQIAEQHKCSAYHVYKLAHGMQYRTSRDSAIIKSLYEKNIISGFF